MSNARQLAQQAVVPASFRNKLINGKFDVWQRGLSFVNMAGNSLIYVADRWCVAFATAAATGSVQYGAFGVGGVEPLDKGALIMSVPANAAGSNLRQRIEGVHTLAGQMVTLSFYVAANSGSTTLGLNVTQNFGSGGSASVANLLPQTISVPNNVYQRAVFTFQLPSIAGKTIGAGDFLELSIQTQGTAAHTLGFAGAQLEAGTVPTPLEIRPYSLEMLMCQRYYEKAWYRVDGQTASSAIFVSTMLTWAAEKRVQPTVTRIGEVATNITWNSAGVQGTRSVSMIYAAGASAGNAQAIAVADVEL